MSGGGLGRVREMVRKEFLQLFRDPKLVRILFVAPILQLLLFGYAVSTEVRNTSLYVVDPEGSRAARELVEAFTASGYFRVVGGSDRPADLVAVLEHGDAIAGLVLPVGFERDLAAGTARVQLLFDGTNSNTATIAKGYAERIVQRFALDRAGFTRAPAIDLRLSAWYNPDLDSRNYNVPAVIGLLLMLISLLLTSLAVVREREIGTLDQLLVSPLGALELLLGKTIPFALVGVADLVLVTSVARLWFGVPLRGSAWLLLGATLLFLLCGLGLGLLVSTVSKTQQEAFLSSFLIFIPTILLSGFMFPVSSMPPFFRWLTLGNPMRHFLECVRGIFLRGSTAADLAPQLGALAFLGVLLFGSAVARFARRER